MKKLLLLLILAFALVTCSKPDYSNAGTQPGRSGCARPPYWWINLKANYGLISNADPNNYIFSGYDCELPPGDCPPNILGTVYCCIKAFPKDNDPEHPDLSTITDHRFLWP